MADPEDRRAKRVYLTEAVEPPMKVMRKIAAGVREDALCGVSAEERDRFVDILLTVKGNLLTLANGPAQKANGGGNRA